MRRQWYYAFYDCSLKGGTLVNPSNTDPRELQQYLTQVSIRGMRLCFYSKLFVVYTRSSYPSGHETCNNLLTIKTVLVRARKRHTDGSVTFFEPNSPGGEGVTVWSPCPLYNALAPHCTGPTPMRASLGTPHPPPPTLVSASLTCIITGFLSIIIDLDFYSRTVLPLLALIGNFDLQHGLEFDYNQEATLVRAARPHIDFNSSCI